MQQTIYNAPVEAEAGQEANVYTQECAEANNPCTLTPKEAFLCPLEGGDYARWSVTLSALKSVYEVKRTVELILVDQVDLVLLELVKFLFEIEGILYKSSLLEVCKKLRCDSLDDKYVLIQDGRYVFSRELKERSLAKIVVRQKGGYDSRMNPRLKEMETMTYSMDMKLQAGVLLWTEPMI
jgi:hypothetical protein